MMDNVQMSKVYLNIIQQLFEVALRLERIYAFHDDLNTGSQAALNIFIVDIFDKIITVSRWRILFIVHGKRNNIMPFLLVGVRRVGGGGPGAAGGGPGAGDN